MRTAILMMLLCAMTACAADAPNNDPVTSVENQDLVCDPNCDPGGAQPLINAVFNEGQSFGELESGSMRCHHYAAGFDPWGVWHAAVDECSAIYQDPWGQQYLVDCSSANGCGTRACGFPVPDQDPCR